MSNEPHVGLEGVGVTYEAPQRPPLVALNDIDLTIQRGEFVSVLGPSGCGKSTLLRVVAGLQLPTQGRVLIEGDSPDQAQKQKQIGVVFQDPSLLPWRSVIDNVALPLQVNRKAGTAAVAEPRQLTSLVGLADFEGYYPHQLSGGMQQRVAIARALVTSPSLLLMDEPFGALDEMSRSSMRHDLLRIWRSHAENSPTSVLFVTHSIAEAVTLSDRVVVMTPQPGRIAAVIEIDMPRPRDEDVELTPLFIEYVAQLRTILRSRSAA